MMRMATKQTNVLKPLQLILIVIALYGVRQLQHCKSVTDICIDITTMAVRFDNNPLRSNQSKYSGTSPYGYLTSKVTSPLGSPLISPKLYSTVQFSPL